MTIDKRSGTLKGEFKKSQQGAERPIGMPGGNKSASNNPHKSGHKK